MSSQKSLPTAIKCSENYKIVFQKNTIFCDFVWLTRMVISYELRQNCALFRKVLRDTPLQR